MRKLQTWKMIRQNIGKNIPVVMLYVLDSQGSSPGRQGFLMAVNAEGAMSGSIGGGIMEHKWVEVAKEKLNSPDTGFQVQRQVHDKAAAKNQSGMICSGEQTLFIYRIQSTDRPAVEALVHSLESGESGTLLLGPEGIAFRKEIPAGDFYFRFRSDEDWEYREQTGYRHHLSIIGGGHCSLALSRLMRDLDFYIRVFDDRPGLSTMEENRFAHEKKQLPGYQDLQRVLPRVAEHYVVVMTFGYRTDDEAIRSLCGMELRYLGLLGSGKKIGQMMESYKRENFPPQWLAAIHAPVGLDISSRTPEEIAVSIAAQIIRIKNALPSKNEQDQP